VTDEITRFIKTAERGERQRQKQQRKAAKRQKAIARTANTDLATRGAVQESDLPQRLREIRRIDRKMSKLDKKPDTAANRVAKSIASGDATFQRLAALHEFGDLQRSWRPAQAHATGSPINQLRPSQRGQVHSVFTGQPEPLAPNPAQTMIPGQISKLEKKLEDALDRSGYAAAERASAIASDLTYAKLVAAHEAGII
jgi:hypothetical protein